MSQHSCPRCGYATICDHGSWPDRHPIMATVGGLYTLTFMGMMVSVYPGPAWVMTAVAGLVAGVRAVRREVRRRAALRARADWEHASLMARSLPQPIRLPAREVSPQARPAAWERSNTEPVRVAR